MKPNLSAQSKSFLILFVVALIGTYICLLIARSINLPTDSQIAMGPNMGYQTTVYPEKNSTGTQTMAKAPVDPVVDTSKWKSYTDPTYHFSFLYPPTWKPKKAVTKNGFYTLVFDPGSKYDNITIYVSTTGYFALEGLPETKDTVAGQPAENIEGALYGFQYQGNYYTLDSGISLATKVDFRAMVKTFRFN